jgi:SAM-dependent methyltransferase
MNDWFVEMLRCPACSAPVRLDTAGLVCGCGHRIPVVNDIPVYLEGRASYQASPAYPEVDASNPTIRALHEGIAAELARLPLEGRMVLDVGSGGCFPAAYIAKEHHCQVVALEACRQVLDHYGNQFLGYFGTPAERISRICASALALPFSSQCFDIVLGTGYLHHFEDPLTLLKGIARCVKPGGLVVGVNESVRALFRGMGPISSDEDRPKTYPEWIRSVPAELYRILEMRASESTRRRLAEKIGDWASARLGGVFEVFNSVLFGSSITIVLERR